MRVDLSGHKFIFPQHCACCGAMPQTTLAASASRSTGTRVVHTTSKSWDFPYCAQCTEHVRIANNAASTTAIIVTVSLIIASYLYFMTSVQILGGLVAVAGIVGSIFAYNSLMTQANNLCGQGCACVKSAVGYLGWQGSCHMFEITSPGYASAFMVANQSKLVNVRPEVWQWLQANGYAAPPHQPQTARRHIK